MPAELAAHLIVENYAIHQHAAVKAWLAKRPRFHMHYISNYSSWLSHVERWLGLITQRVIKCGYVRNVRELVGRVDVLVAHYNTSRTFA